MKITIDQIYSDIRNAINMGSDYGVGLLSRYSDWKLALSSLNAGLVVLFFILSVFFFKKSLVKKGDESGLFGFLTTVSITISLIFFFLMLFHIKGIFVPEIVLLQEFTSTQ